MSRTSTLRKQHDSILVLIGEIDEAAAGMATSLDAGRLHRLLRQLDTILRRHLASEDRLLYPQMLASGDRETVVTASRFCEHMGGLLNAYSAFADRWASAASLLVNPPGFLRDWRALLTALSMRIERENAELYPLADALDEPAHLRAG